MLGTNIRVVVFSNIFLTFQGFSQALLITVIFASNNRLCPAFKVIPAIDPYLQVLLQSSPFHPCIHHHCQVPLCQICSCQVLWFGLPCSMIPVPHWAPSLLQVLPSKHIEVSQCVCFESQQTANMWFMITLRLTHFIPANLIWLRKLQGPDKMPSNNLSLMKGFQCIGLNILQTWNRKLNQDNEGML